MMPYTISADDAIAKLAAEGYEEDDVVAAFDSLIDAGLEADQPDEGYVLTADEVQVLRDQLNVGYELDA